MQLAGGNSALALAMTVISNLLGILIVSYKAISLGLKLMVIIIIIIFLKYIKENRALDPPLPVLEACQHYHYASRLLEKLLLKVI